ncbi:MAG: ECF-type sigma factor [Acidobacteria bacterium]|nr:ECF-type sigma factor [Acidobacteriota bacterium]
MATEGGPEITALLAAWRDGEPGSRDRLMELAYPELRRLDHRKSRLVELRYFAGLTVEEAARALDISVETAKRDWRLAKAWLLAELTRQNPAT